MSACLSENAVLALVTGRLSGPALDAAEAHLDACPGCRQLVASAARTDHQAADPAHAATAASLGPGRDLGQYRLVRQLGAGGMGAVFEGIHREIASKVAIKVLHPHIALRPELATRLVNEARAANLIEHPGIVDVFEIGRLPDGSFYLVMELLRGVSLATRLAAAPPLAVVEVMRLGRQLAAALAVAHERGIVHRDLKPQNVFLAADGEAPSGWRAKLLDFGVAKLPSHLQAPGAEVHTEEGALLGTALYMSPEQCRGAAITDRADVYALGVMLYEMLAGSPPFRADGLGTLLELHMHAEPPPLGDLRPDLAPATVALVRAMLAKQPSERPAMAEVVERLAPARADELAPAPRRALGTRGKAAVAGVLATGAAALAIWLWPAHAPAVRWELSSVPAGADVVSPDGRVLGATPWQVERARREGVLQVTLRRAGYLDEPVVLDESHDERATVKLRVDENQQIRILE